MKHLIQSLKFATIFTLMASGFIGVTLFPANAETVPRSVTNALAYPTSSQRFFEEGYEQLEREIQRLQEPAPATPVLSVNPDLQQQDLQQWQPWDEEQLTGGGDRLPTESQELPALPQ